MPPYLLSYGPPVDYNCGTAPRLHCTGSKDIFPRSVRVPQLDVFVRLFSNCSSNGSRQKWLLKHKHAIPERIVSLQYLNNNNNNPRIKSEASFGKSCFTSGRRLAPVPGVAYSVRHHHATLPGRPSCTGSRFLLTCGQCFNSIDWLMCCDHKLRYQLRQARL